MKNGAPLDSGSRKPEPGSRDTDLTRDTAALQIVTVRSPRLVEAVEKIPEGDYSEAYFLHGFGVRLAEAAAEYVHGRIRRELGMEPDQGLRYSWGYGACPDPLQHETVFRMLPAEARLDMSLTEAGSLVPELSTAALVVHHPEARYFSV
jgi:5-methyltetrahydrofolate--homocysteine methyltransferase